MFIDCVSVARCQAVLLGALSLVGLLWPAAASADNFLTQSERVLCAVTPDESLVALGPDAVVCQGDFAQAPPDYNGAVTTGDGSFHWEQGNIAVYSSTTHMEYGHTYYRGNWAIYHDETGTRFTNDRTGHGMFVSAEEVYAF